MDKDGCQNPLRSAHSFHPLSRSVRLCLLQQMPLSADRYASNPKLDFCSLAVGGGGVVAFNPVHLLPTQFYTSPQSPWIWPQNLSSVFAEPGPPVAIKKKNPCECCHVYIPAPSALLWERAVRCILRVKHTALLENGNRAIFIASS